jgi:hypothetical protein
MTIVTESLLGIRFWFSEYAIKVGDTVKYTTQADLKTNLKNRKYVYNS